MIHEILSVGLLHCNCSIFGDEQTREAIVVDPGDDIADVLAILKKHELKVKAIVITPEDGVWGTKAIEKSKLYRCVASTDAFRVFIVRTGSKR